jgi:hypothetical protein
MTDFCQGCTYDTPDKCNHPDRKALTFWLQPIRECYTPELGIVASWMQMDRTLAAERRKV